MFTSLQQGNYDDKQGSHDPQNGQHLQEDFPGEIEKKSSLLCCGWIIVGI